jgi:hypothetical protein
MTLEELHESGGVAWAWRSSLRPEQSFDLMDERDVDTWT